MKIINVDFSGNAPSVSTAYGGEKGEHQAVRLVVTPEANMSADENIAFYYLLFEVEGGLVASRTYSQGDEITCALWGQLTEQRNLRFQLIGTNGVEDIIAKSPIITLYLGNSLEGTVIGIDDNRDSLIAMIGAFNERLDGDEEELADHERRIDALEESGATKDYTELTNKPSINSVELNGNKTSGDLGLVSAEQGKGLSTEDYTTAEKTKLAGIEAGAEVNPIWGNSLENVGGTVNVKTVDLFTNSATLLYTGQQILDMFNAGINLLYRNRKVFTAVVEGGDCCFYLIRPRYNADVTESDFIVERRVIGLDSYSVATNNIYSDRYYFPLPSSANAGKVVSVATGGGYELTTPSGGSSDYSALSNKPSINSVELSGNKTSSDLGLVSAESGKGLSTNDYTDAEKTKLGGIAAGAEVNVQSDWSQSDNTADDYIKNKPNLATVATSGSYNDLTDKPTIPSEASVIDLSSYSVGSIISDADTIAKLQDSRNVVKVGDAYLRLTAHETTQNYYLYTAMSQQAGGDYIVLVPSSGSLYYADKGTASWEVPTNKVPSSTGLSSSSTDTQYPSAKCVYDYVASNLGTPIEHDSNGYYITV